MEIIKKGREIPRTMQVTCKVCGAELEIEGNDLEKFESQGQLGIIFSYYYTCPCCSESNSIKQEDLSEGIRLHFNK